MQPLLDLDITAWDGAADRDTQARVVDALEDGRVVFFPRLAFPLAPAEQRLLDPATSDGKAKNITWFADSRVLKGLSASADRAAVTALLERYAATARRFVETLFPGYAGSLAWGPTTLRPVEIAGRTPPSWRRDDTRLHTDAFPSRPTRGTRILRLFSNVDPAGVSRVWRVGGRFEDYAASRAGHLRGMLPGQPWLMSRLGITGGRRSPYDQLMLQLHDSMKSDAAYQRDGIAAEIAFPPGSSWMVFTDQVPHAAIAGRNALEQTFQLPVAALRFPERAPLRVLERLRGEPLVP
jgi:hypothetical protein